MYPFLILILCFLIQGGFLGIISNCRGLFYVPVCADLSMELGEFTTYSVFYGLAVCIAIPFAAKAVRKWNLRLTLTSFALAASFAQYSMSWFTKAWQWYIAAAVQGICYAFLFVPTVPMLINNWFVKRRGFFLGIACSASGIIGALMNMAAGKIMADYGWRRTYQFSGIVLFLLLVPVCLLFAVRKPEDIGAKPYGNTAEGVLENDQKTENVHFTHRKQIFVLLLIFTCVSCFTVGYSQLLFGLGLSFDHPDEILSTFVSASMIGTILCKLFIGWLHDRKGAGTACYAAMGVVLVGFLSLLQGGFLPLMYIGAFCMGMPMAVSVVVIPNAVRGIFGGEEFEQRYRITAVFVNLASNFSFTILGWLVSAFGSYRATIFFGIAMSLISLATLNLLFTLRNRSMCDE